MSKETHIKRNKGDSVHGNTDYKRLKKMTEKDVEENANTDPDAPLLTDEELKKFKKITPKKD
ncbi:hypothetical protein [Shewanella baltica]|uniref:hypothetical protein n=1 Tax=Shewanella baltica TaxID=62322 RepID=UPI00217CE975|nr:hypothetical protein [Shewanella baltica]MCS6180044.1 hypothetical protein [Shewanella baltica]MCS6256137.1 hypothetical protein [Shewanella baltica]